MKSRLSITLFFISFFLHGALALQPVSYVDINKYAGKWYEIATYPQWFQRGLTNVSATYTLKKGYVEVYNASLKNNTPKDITGKAFVVPKSNNTKLKVQFFWPFKGDYWIIDLDKDYKWAVVSDPTMKTLWILCRTPQMDKQLYQGITERLAKRGFDLSKLVLTDQSVNIHKQK